MSAPAGPANPDEPMPASTKIGGTLHVGNSTKSITAMGPRE